MAILRVLSNMIQMKRLLMIVALVASSLSGFTQEQQDTVNVVLRKNVVKFFPIDLPFQSISFEY